MNRKQKKEQKRLLSTRQLMGIDQFTDNGLKAGRSELVYFLKIGRTSCRERVLRLV